MEGVPWLVTAMLHIDRNTAKLRVDVYSSRSEVPPANPGTLRFHEFPYAGSKLMFKRKKCVTGVEDAPYPAYAGWYP